MKRIAILIAVLLVARTTFAQVVSVEQRGTINRVDAETGVYSRPVFHLTSPMEVQSSKHTFTIIFDSTTTQMVAGNTVAIGAHINNMTTNDVALKFFRYHLHIPDSWTASICFGDNCYAPRTDSFPPLASFTLPSGPLGGDFRLNLYCPANAGTSDSIVDYVRFVADGSDPGDTLSVLLTGYYLTEGVDQNVQPVLATPHIMSLFPSPLFSGNSIRLRVNVPHEMAFNYAIFDEMGRKVAFGTSRQHLFAGDNICEIGELGGYANGNYTVKFSFADGSVDSRMFQIMR